jgi:hypothetical protein
VQRRLTRSTYEESATMTIRWWTLILLAGFGCTKDSSSANGGAGGASGTGGVAGAALAAGVGGVAHAGAAAGSGAGAGGAVPGGMQISCGSVVCKNPLAMVGDALKLAEPCCLDAATASCGWVTSGVCMPPPPLEPRCPQLTVPSLLPTLAPMPADPCCTSGGRCGVALPQVSLGCFETTSFPGSTAAPMNCDGTPIAGDVDAGQ